MTLPPGWRETRLRYVAALNPSKSEARNLPAGTEVSFLPMQAVGEDGSFDLGQVRPVEEVASGYTYFRDGDILLAKITPCFENGKAALVRGLVGGCGFGSTEFHVVRPKPGADARFLFYLSRSAPFMANGAASMTGAGGQKRVPADFLLDFRCSLPPRLEQEAVADFLDHETARIDALAAKQDAFLAVLNEHRRAFILEAVVGGLSSSTPKQDTAIAAFPSIPMHWSVKRMRHLSPQMTVGVVVNPSTYVSPDGLPFFFGGDVTEAGLSDRNARRISPANSAQVSKSVLRAGDLVMVRVGYPGLTAVVPPEFDGANCASIIIIRGRSSFHSGWLCYVLNSSVGRVQVDAVKYGAAQEQFNLAHAVEFKVPVPPWDEQIAIARHLDDRLSRLDALRHRCTEVMERLREHRLALITAAVTGRIDVRDRGHAEAAE